MRIALITDGIAPYVIGGMQKHSFYLAKYFAKNHMKEMAIGLTDKFYSLRLLSLDNIMNDSAMPANADVLRTVENMVNNDPEKRVQAKAIELLASTSDAKYKPLFEK